MWNDGGNFGGGGGGGGFLESTFASPSAEGEKKKDRRAENVVPVSIGQILSSGEEFRIGEIIVHVVTFVGKVKNIEMSSTKLTYLIEDGSGEVEALLWLEGQLNANQPTLNSYCRVSGTVRVTQGRRHVMIFNVRPITDLNEVTAHLLEVIDVYQSAQNLTDEMSYSAQSSNVAKTNNTLANSMMNMSDMDDGLDKSAPADPQQRIVFKVIANAALEDEGGVDVPFITKKLNGRMAEAQVRTITDFLLTEGFIFSTIDDEHFTVTK